MQNLHKILNILPNEHVAIIGSGGKTTLLYLLANERKKNGAFITTTTHIMRPDICDKILCPNEFINLDPMLYKNMIIAGLTVAENDKCTGLNVNDISLLKKNEIPLIYEADGSKRLPAKLHNNYEPVISHDTDKIILVFGLSAMGKPVCDVCHRYEIKFNKNDIFSEQHLIYCIKDGIKSANFPVNNVRLILNQADIFKNISDCAKDIILKLCPHTYIGSLNKNFITKL